MARQGRVKGEPPCPRCGRILNGFTCMDGTRAPRAGDISVCAYCAAPLSWDGEAFSPLTGSALVLARLDPNFLEAEELARRTRITLKKTD